MTHLPVLQARLALGIRTDIIGNAWFLNDEDVVYPVGASLAFHNFYQKRVKFIKLPNKGLEVNRIDVSPNRKLITVAERGERPTVTIYDAVSHKRRKQIQIPLDKEVSAKEFVCITFTFDAKHMICCTGEPDWTFYVFNWMRNKLESYSRGNNLNGTGTVEEIACNPNDINVIAVVGENVMKALAHDDNQWRSFGYSKTENCHFTSACWLTQDRLLCGSFGGSIIVVEGGELKQVLNVKDTTVLDFKMVEEEEKQPGMETDTEFHEVIVQSTVTKDERVRRMVPFSRGLLFTQMTGAIHFFEKETNYKYRKRTVYSIPNNTVQRDNEEPVILNTINSLDVNPSQDRIIATCLQNQIFTVRLWGTDITASYELGFHEMGLSLHHGPIGGLDVCLWKPIFVTTGEWDRKIKIWNFDTEKLELTKQFQEDIYGVALHPTGLYMVVGFAGKLRFLVILIDDLITKKEFGIRYCKEIAFSKRGHLFAAVNGNVIQVYSSTSFENVVNLKGHSGWVRGMSWCKNDSKLVSCGTEGALYEWDISTGKRSSEIILKNCVFQDVVFTNPGRGNYSVSADGIVRENVEWSVNKERFIVSTGLENVVLSHLDAMLFVTGNFGSIYSVKLPLQEDSAFLEFTMHHCSIVKAKITDNDALVITISEIGDIFLWKVLNAETRSIKLDKELLTSSDILIPREILENKLNEVDFLHRRLSELESEHSYQTRMMEQNNAAKIKSIHEGYCKIIEELKEKNSMTEMEHAQEITKINEDIANMKKDFNKQMAELEVSYNEKLITEYDKYIVLEDSKTAMRANYEQELEDLRDAKKSSEEQLTTDFMQRLNEKDVHIEELMEELNKRAKEHEMIKQQIEDDADREIYELKAEHEKLLHEEQDANMKLKGETGILKKKLLTAHKDVDELKLAVYNLENDQTKLKNRIMTLEKDIIDLKNEIAERDVTIHDKERRILEMKRRNQELEKFKFILDYKIKELKAQIEPRERKISEQTEQINDMVRELENLQKIIISLDLQLVELREKLLAADNELEREISKNRAAKAALKTIRTDLHNASGLTQEVPKLIEAVKNMYHKYNADKDFEQAQAEDNEAKSEFLRQRDFLERTIKTLQNQISKSISSGGMDKIKLVDENAELVADTSLLRKQLKAEQRKCKNLESVLGLSSKYMLPQEAQKRLQAAVATREEIHNEYKQQLEEDENRIDLLRSENRRLLRKLTDQQIELTQHGLCQAPPPRSPQSE